jgi:Kef-type K+ transport system membrane component KefB
MPDLTTDMSLLAIAVVLFVGVASGCLVRRFRHPAVIGEIVAGVLLGPSALGLLPGHVIEHLFTAGARQSLTAVGQVGLLVFMFGLGSHMDAEVFSGRRRQVGAIAVSGLVLPITVGLGCAFVLHQWWSAGNAPGASTLAFMLFLGADFGVTAFPVLARLLDDEGLRHTKLGALSLGTAAFVDVATWVLLVAVVAIARSTGPGELTQLLVATALLVLFTRYVLRPLLGFALRRYPPESVPVSAIAFLFAGILAMGWLTSALGLHQIFGGFLFGLAMPRGALATVTANIVDRMDAVGALLLPLFFVTVGLNVDVRSLTVVALLVYVAVVGLGSISKMGSVTVAARVTGEEWRAAAAIGTLMNTRGLTELAVLDVGFSLGVLSKAMFAVLVLASITRTTMTIPILRRIDLAPDAELLQLRPPVPAQPVVEERLAS